MSDVRARRVVTITFGTVVLCAWCGWASGFHHSTTPAFATWSASLAVVVVLDVLFWRGRRRRRFALHLPAAEQEWPRPGLGGSTRVFRGISPWLLLFLVVLVWELLGIDTGAHQAHLTISALAQAFRPLDAALLAVWVLVGLGYGAARARAPLSAGSSEAAPGLAPGGFLLAEGHHVLLPALLLPQSRAVGVAFWVGVIVVSVLIDLAARRSQGRRANAEEFVRVISRPMVANALLVAAWVFAGWHLFAH